MKSCADISFFCNWRDRVLPRLNRCLVHCGWGNGALNALDSYHVFYALDDRAAELSAGRIRNRNSASQASKSQISV